MVGVVPAVGRLEVQVGGVPTVAAHERDGDALLLRLLGGQVDDVVVVGQVHDVGLGGRDLGEDGREVGVLVGVGFLAHDLAALLR